MRESLHDFGGNVQSHFTELSQNVTQMQDFKSWATKLDIITSEIALEGTQAISRECECDG